MVLPTPTATALMLNVWVTQREATACLEAGHEIAREQFLLHQAPRRPQGAAAARISQEGDTLVIKAGDLAWGLDAKTARIISWRHNGQEQLAAPRNTYPFL